MLRNYLYFVLLVTCVLGDRSFTIVVDTTGSMRDEIDLFKYNLEPIMQAMTSGHFDNFILLPFLHLDPGPPLISRSPQGLIDLINAIEVSERYDCRENSLSAIRKALEVSKKRSLIFVFTDAEAQDTDKLYSIQNLCENLQSQVVIFQSGSCPQDSRILGMNENIYKKIVTSCRGSYFSLNINDLQMSFEYMREIAKEDWTEINSHKEFYGNTEYSFSIDVYTKDMLVAISGNNPQIEIKNNFGKKVKVDEIIVTSYMMVLRIPKTMIGDYSATVSCNGAILMTVYRKKEFKFRHGFSPLQPKSLRETTLLPIPGILNYLLISLPDNNLQLVSIQMKIFGENDRTVDHHIVDGDKKLYAATILIEPEKTFQVLVKCRDGNHNEISSASNQMEPQRLVSDSQRILPQAEILETDPLIDFGTGYFLACKVNSYPRPSIWWVNSMQEIMHSESALLEIPYLYISYVRIENVTKNETITCKCENDEGEDSIDANIYVNRTFTFEIIQPPSDITIEYGSEGKLFCKAETYPEAEIKWYHNETIVENSDIIEIIPDEQALLIKMMNLDATGEYECKISNTLESRTLSAKVYISGLEMPEIKLEDLDIVLKPGDQMELECTIVKGKPFPEISWKYKSTYDNNELSEVPDGVTADGAVLKIDSANLDHSGFYVCEANNILGMDEKEVSVKVLYPPKIRNDDEHKIVTFGDAVELRCDVDAVPEAVVHWNKYKDDVIVPLDDHHTSDYSNTLRYSLPNNSTDLLIIYLSRFTNYRFIANDKDCGTYVCLAENSVGSAIRTVTLNVLVAPYIEALAWRSLTAGRGSTIVLNCNVTSGIPVPSTRWLFISPNLETTELIRGNSAGKLEYVLKNITKKHEGSYQCIAENEVASDSIRVSLKVV